MESLRVLVFRIIFAQSDVLLKDRQSSDEIIAKCRIDFSPIIGKILKNRIGYPIMQIPPMVHKDITTTIDVHAEFGPQKKQEKVKELYSESNMNYLRQLIADVDSGKTKLVEHDLIED